MGAVKFSQAKVTLGGAAVWLVEREVDELQIAKLVCSVREWVIGALAGNP